MLAHVNPGDLIVSRRARRYLCGAVAVLIFLLGSEAAADPALSPELPLAPPFAHLMSGTLHVDPSTLHPDARDFRLPPSYVMNDATWIRLDTEVRRLQTVETRLTAENTSLRASADGWQPGWLTLGTVLAAGLVGGWYAHSKL